MLILVQVFTSLLAISSYCDLLTYGNYVQLESSSSSPKNVITLNSGITEGEPNWKEITELSLSTKAQTAGGTEEPGTESTPPMCGCDSMKLMLGTIEEGVSWFAVQFNTTSSIPQCVFEDLAELNVTVEGPCDKNVSITQDCLLKNISCLNGSNNSFSFNSSICCDSIELFECSNYVFWMSPRYLTCAEYASPETGSIFTQPGPNMIPQNVTVDDAGNDWVSIVWQDYKFCLNTVNSYLMHFDPLYPKGDTFDKPVPESCANRSWFEPFEGVTNFNSKIQLQPNCELFPLEPCTNYSVAIEVEIHNNYLSAPSESITFNTKPPDDLFAQIEQVESGSDWLAFQWKLSSPQCHTVTTGFRFNLTNLRNNSYEAYDCNITDPVDSKFVFNTSSNDCGKSIIVSPCSDYEIVVIPQILNSFYDDGSHRSALGRTTCEPITASISSINSGSDWISFNWTTNVEDCRKNLTGFWLSITSAEPQREQDLLRFISMEDCYCNLKEDQPIMFNTSTTCGNWINPGIFPCSEYNINIIPQFFGSLNGSANPSDKAGTLPDDGITPLVQNVKAGMNWISFEWQASTNTCRDDVTGLWISMNSSNVLYLKNCSINGNFDQTITFNTSSTCFNQTLSPCSRYVFQIQLDMQGNKIGISNKVNKRTTPGDDVTALIEGEKYGVNWISFQWKSSVPECQCFIREYQLNVTHVFNKTTESRHLYRNCSSNQLVHNQLVFNSSLLCAELVIYPCSNYSISLAPVFHIDKTIINGVPSTLIGIGTQSGELGEIEHPIVASQETNSLTLAWFEPMCRNLSYYNVTVIPNWNLESGINEKEYLTITPDCLKKHPNGSVSLTLNNTTCGKGYNFVSCAPYNISILPVYELASANENLVGWTNDTQTLPAPYEASVNNLAVEDVGTRWISITWPIPTCRVPVVEWILSKSVNVVIPPDCPTSVNASHLSLNISEAIVCKNGTIHSAEPFIPCTHYKLGMNVKYSNLEVQSGTNNVISAVTKIEPPGIVHKLTSKGTNNSVLINWVPPKRNPQCVENYQVKWSNHEIKIKMTQYLIEDLEPCSMFRVTVNALPDSSHNSYENHINVSTNSVDPAPVISEITVVKLQNEWTRNVSWLKPQVDDCISGYNVSIQRAISAEVVYNVTLEGKDTTWTTLNEGFEPGSLYNISISSFCSFKQQVSVSKSITHAFTWDSPSNMIDATTIVCGIIFPILALAIVYAVVQIRKSHGSVLASEKCLEVPTPSRKSPPSHSQRPVIIKELKSTIEWLEADSNYELSKEYESIKSMSNKTATCIVAELPENRAKNRYVDILPYDHSRVRLASHSSDYINASYLSGYAGHRTYIATQGPKPSTIEDFWLMCFEQNVNIIVALTQLEERGKIKCAQYWPTTGSCEYGDIRVELTSEVKENNYTIRDFLLTKISSSVAPKFTKQMHFTEWPDFGCPENPEQLIQFVHAMRDKRNFLYVTSPIVVHCSAGVGRTGTLVALDILMEQARSKKIIDVMNTIIKLRNDRDRMVQTEEQYHFLYKCIYTYARNELQFKENSPSGSARSHSPDSIALTPLSFFQKDPFANNFSRKSSFNAE